MHASSPSTNGSHRARPRWTRRTLAWSAMLGLGLVALGALALTASSPFEIDGNAVGNGGDDWATLPTADIRLQRDPVKGEPTADNIFVQGGSKDERDISSAGITSQYWLHGTGSIPDKDDLVQAFATELENGSGTKVLYFGATRFANDGDAAIGFWFLKKPIKDVSGGAFSGMHTVGDILVTSDFRKGGGASVVNVFEWTGAPFPGSTKTHPLHLLASSALKLSGSQSPPPVAYCDPADPGVGNKKICAMANAVPTPVPGIFASYVYKSGGGTISPADFPVGTFFEGGIDLAALGLSSETCFSSFLAMTRSSASTSAQLKDFVLKEFSDCGVSVAKSCPLPPDVHPTETGKLQYDFLVPITNTGGGPLYDVQLSDTFLAGESCRITEIDTGAENIALTSGVRTLVASSIAAGQTINVLVECASERSPMRNSVSVAANFTPNQSLTAPDVEDSYTVGDGGTAEEEACTYPGDPDISITKTCDGEVSFVNGALRVCTSIALENTGTEPLSNITVYDPTITGNAAPIASGISLAPGATTTLNGSTYCYTPTLPNGPISASAVSFSNTASVTATGAISGKAIPATGDPAISSTADCPLCVCEDCDD